MEGAKHQQQQQQPAPLKAMLEIETAQTINSSTFLCLFSRRQSAFFLLLLLPARNKTSAPRQTTPFFFVSCPEAAAGRLAQINFLHSFRQHSALFLPPYSHTSSIYLFPAWFNTSFSPPLFTTFNFKQTNKKRILWLKGITRSTKKMDK
jgi:hypothetical protein